MRVLVLLLLLPWANAAPPPDAFARAMLAAHNRVRAQVRVPNLAWSDQMAAFARRWADSLIAQNRLAHNPRTPYGENLYEIQGEESTPQEVIEAWAGEAADYDYRSGGCRGLCGHYTQLVWRATARVGCAVARNRHREVWVCEYDPPGNVIGQRPY